MDAYCMVYPLQEQPPGYKGRENSMGMYYRSVDAKI